MVRLNRHSRRRLAAIGSSAFLAAIAPAHAGNLTGVTVGADRSGSTANPLFCVGGPTCVSPLGSYPAAGGQFVHQGDGSQLNLTVGGVTKNFPAWWATIGQPGGPASLGSSGTVPLAQIPVTKDATGVAGGADSRIVGAYAMTPNRPAISPSATSIGVTVATVFPAGVYVSVRIRMTGSGQTLACTGDGTTPAVGTSTTATAPGQDIFWPIQTGGAMPSGPFQCVATGTVTIAAEAH